MSWFAPVIFHENDTINKEKDILISRRSATLKLNIGIMRKLNGKLTNSVVVAEYLQFLWKVLRKLPVEYWSKKWKQRSFFAIQNSILAIAHFSNTIFSNTIFKKNSTLYYLNKFFSFANLKKNLGLVYSLCYSTEVQYTIKYPKYLKYKIT